MFFLYARGLLALVSTTLIFFGTISAGWFVVKYQFDLPDKDIDRGGYSYSADLGVWVSELCTPRKCVSVTVQKENAQTRKRFLPDNLTEYQVETILSLLLSFIGACFLFVMDERKYRDKDISRKMKTISIILPLLSGILILIPCGKSLSSISSASSRVEALGASMGVPYSVILCMIGGLTHFLHILTILIMVYRKRESTKESQQPSNVQVTAISNGSGTNFRFTDLSPISDVNNTGLQSEKL